MRHRTFASLDLVDDILGRCLVRRLVVFRALADRGDAAAAEADHDHARADRDLAVIEGRWRPRIGDRAIESDDREVIAFARVHIAVPERMEFDIRAEVNHAAIGAIEKRRGVLAFAEHMGGRQDAALAVDIADPAARADRPAIAIVAGEGHEARELWLVGKADMGAEAFALAPRPATLGLPRAVEDNDGSGRAGNGQGRRSQTPAEKAAPVDFHCPRV